MYPALTIARTTFIEAVRQPIYFILILLGGLGIIFTTWSAGYSMGFVESGEVSGDNRVLLDLSLATVFLCGTLLAGFIATAAMSREIENKTVLTIVSKPVPRPVLVLGKYLGVTAAVLVAVLTLIVFLFLGLRHRVLSTAADDPDMPVILFSFAAVLIAAGAGVWGNFFYGWSFPQTFALWLCPLSILAYALVLLIDRKWNLQPMSKDFKPQTMLICLVLLMSMPVLCAIATAASTRLGQVMTIVVCFGMFVLGLLSTVFFGASAFRNEPLSMIGTAEPVQLMYTAFDKVGDEYQLRLKSPPPRKPEPGDPVYYGPSASGVGMAVPRFEPFRGQARDMGGERMFVAEPAVVVLAYDTELNTLTIRQIGRAPVGVSRPPRAGDFLFSEPTRINLPALAGWGMLPNLHFFWLLDAVAQNQPVPWAHVLLVGAYALCQTIVFLSLAVVLFQRRDVG